MWNYTQDDWLKEVKRSLKSETEPVFKKKITADRSIFPFSKKIDNGVLQKNVALGRPFLTVQNYSDLKKADMTEWVLQDDVGLRFRQFEDLSEFATNPQLKGKHTFLSQPFPFLIDTPERKEIIPLLEDIGHLNLGWSPLSFGLTRGEILKRPFAGWEKIFQQPEIHRDSITWFYLSSAPYQWAGAEPHVELSVVLSLAFSILKELDAMKFPIETVMNKISFGLSLGTDVLTESAKITALKTLWDRLGELACDGPSQQGPQNRSAEVYVLPSLRCFSGRDPWNNIMRLTLMSFAAMTGGAQGFKCIPYDVLNHQKSLDAIRVSTNIPLLLKKEGFMNLVENPYDGSSLFQQTVEVLCESAWAHFQEIERKGGIFEAVRSGWLQAEIKRSGEASKDRMSYCETELVGINKFVSRDPQFVKSGVSQLVKLNDIIDPLFLKKSDDDYLSVEPLVVSSLGYEWERMQCLSDKYHMVHKRRPFVTAIRGGGPIVEKKVAWVQHLVHLGGIDVQWHTPEQIQNIESHQSLVVIIPGSDEAEDQIVAALKAKGTEKIWSAGSDRAGLAVDRHIDTQANALEFIQGIHKLRVDL